MPRYFFHVHDGAGPMTRGELAERRGSAAIGRAARFEQRAHRARITRPADRATAQNCPALVHASLLGHARGNHPPGSPSACNQARRAARRSDRPSKVDLQCRCGYRFCWSTERSNHSAENAASAVLLLISSFWKMWWRWTLIVSNVQAASYLLVRQSFRNHERSALSIRQQELSSIANSPPEPAQSDLSRLVVSFCHSRFAAKSAPALAPGPLSE